MNQKIDDASEDDNLTTNPLPKKDRWDKLNILFRPLASIITALTIVGLGAITSSFLDKQKEKENDIRLYTQLMSEREKAEQSLRATMFKEIFDRVLTRPDSKKVENLTDDELQRKELRLLKTHVVGIDMISRNFHEFLDMKPLFLHVMWEIIVERDKLKPKDKKAAKAHEDKCRTVGESWVKSQPCQELLWQQKQLVRIARRVVKKQFDVLAENGATLKLEIPLCTLCLDKNLRTLSPTDHCENLGFETEEVIDLKIGKCTRTATFKINVKRAYLNWNMVQVGIKVSIKNGTDCASKFKEIEMNKKTFWVGSFDFPMVDHTYISAHEKYAIIIDKIDRINRVAKIKLVYFPASDAGLQEKAYYQQKLLERLINKGNLFPDSANSE